MSVKNESQELATAPATDLLSIIQQAVANPNMDVSKLERLFDLYERNQKEQQRIAFQAAMARLQAKLPQIEKHGRIEVKGQLRSKFAPIEDVDAAIRPYCAEEGFSFDFDEDWTDGKSFRISCKMSHREGHSEIKKMTVPLDTNDFRSAIQSRGSTQSYARRYLIMMHLNLVTKDEDNDGNGPSVKITAEEVLDLETQIADLSINKQKFLEYLHIADLRDLLKRDLPTAQQAIATKRRGMK